MESKKQLSLIGSIVILSISIVVAASLISNAINNAAWNHSSDSSSINTGENYELIVNEGWLYFYDTTTGRIWKKADDANAAWEEVKHFTE